MKALSDIKKIAVLGAGTMGPGIAQIYAMGGYTVTMWTRSETAGQKECVCGALTRRSPLGALFPGDQADHAAVGSLAAERERSDGHALAGDLVDVAAGAS